MESKPQMTKTHLLAAELYSYSYDNYADHLEVGNERFTKLMPKDVETLQRAVAEKWLKERIATQLEIDDDKVDMLLERFQATNEVVFAPPIWVTSSISRGANCPIIQNGCAGIKMLTIRESAFPISSNKPLKGSSP